MASRTYRLKEREQLGEGVRRIAVGRIDHALAALRGETDATPAEAVHEARKDLKKLRSLLRLVRGGLGAATFRSENDCFRQLALELAGARDAEVMVATFDELGLEPAVAGPLRQVLEAHRLQVAAGGTAATQPVAERLEAARVRALGWSLSGEGFDVVEPGLRRAYRRGRRRLRRLGAEPGVEDLHDWRKAVKDLWYHHTLLRALWPPVMLAVGDEAHELSERLGTDHDLAMLLDWARRHSHAPPELAAAVEGRRAILQAEALALGRRLYADKPGSFTARVEAWWEAAPSRVAPDPVV
ncbi:MAG TPA: CHAD domain-containing protein [Thermoleophilaceae bacterium]|nr:CHAD domain-containing protein [Thermoleophilaceae bacterium]